MANEKDTDIVNEEEFNEQDMLQEFGDVEDNDDDEIMEFQESSDEDANDFSDTELETFETASIEEEEFVDDDKVESIIEGVLFSTDKPMTLNTIRQAFQGTNIKKDRIKSAIEQLMIEYANPRRGVMLEEIQGGYQLRTKVDNIDYLKRMQKVRPFKLSGPALEVMSIVAYKQPMIKNEVDQIRGVESGHLMRALMDKRLIKFVGKSELPGKPMLYGTTKYFLEVFGLRSIKELPSLSEIDQLIPEGIGEEEKDKEVLADVSEQMGVEQGVSYSESEEELSKISDKLAEIDTTTEFFEQEKQREKERRDATKAKEIQEAIDFEEEVSGRDRKWLERYLAAKEEEAQKQNGLDTSAETEAKQEAGAENSEPTKEEPSSSPQAENLGAAMSEIELQMQELEESGEPAPVANELTEMNFVEDEEGLQTFDFDSEKIRDGEV